MKLLLVVVAAVVAMCTAENVLSADAEEFNQGRVSTQFDFFMIVLQWIPAFSSAFTIHGLWPENRDGTYPQHCSSTSYDESEISDLVPTMNVVWPSNTGDNAAFWEHEWGKHGTCSNVDIHTYFAATVELQARFDIQTILHNSGVDPGASAVYTKSTVSQAIKHELGVVPALHCVSGQLSEVALCLSKSFQLMNCPTSLGSYFVCPNQVNF